jgi:hypothetical protein
MNRSDEKLNQLLNSATLVPPRSNLAERIITQSRYEIQSQSNSQEIAVAKEGFIKQVLRSFIFPKPAYALACSMLVGVLVGWQNPGFNMDTVQVTSADEDLSSLFLAEVNFYE